MTQTKLFKKQFLYSGVLARMIATSFDMTLLSLLTLPIMKSINFYIFTYYFSDVLLQENIVINSSQDIIDLHFNENFQNIAESSYGIIYCSLMGTLIQFLLIAPYFLYCWTKYGVTIGKYIFRIKIVDYETFEKITLSQASLRYLGYLFASITIFTIWFRKDRRGLHDLISNTIALKI